MWGRHMKVMKKYLITLLSCLMLFQAFFGDVSSLLVKAEEASFKQSQTVDGVRITVEADPGVFPADALLKVEKAKGQQLEQVKEAIESVRDHDGIAESYTFDIKILDSEGNELQPNDKAKVKVSFALEEAKDDKLEASVYHTDDELKTSELKAEVKDSTVSVTTDSFSFYTVEFTYKEKQFVMSGGTSENLETILAAVGLTGTIEKAVVSNPELLSITEKDGVWTVESLKPFTTKEWLKVTLDGKEYEIVLTDAAQKYGGGFGNGGNDGQAFWWIDTEGVLTLRPKNAYKESGAVISKGKYTATTWPWAQYKNEITKVVFEGKLLVESGINLENMFNNYPVLTEVDAKTKIESVDGKNFFSGVANADNMFANCAKLEKVDLSGFAANESLWTMKRMFQNDPLLKTVIMNNPAFKTRKEADGGVFMQEFFKNCPALETVDFSNITISGRKARTTYSTYYDYAGFEHLFTGLTNLKTVKLTNMNPEGMKGFTSMFENCTSLTEYDPETDTGLDLTGFVPAEAVDMNSMFKNCTAIKTLDLSSFGKLSNIRNMDSLVAGCTSLENLILDNLDNSVIGPTNMRHWPGSTYEPGFSEHEIGADDFGREIFGPGAIIQATLPNLKVLSAKNSNIWMCKNSRGLPGNEYYLAANDSDVLFFTNKVTEFAADTGASVVIESKRDYVDIITDRDGNAANMPSTPDLTGDYPDKSTNINMINDLNPLGAGKLAPGVYTITSDPWTQKNVEFDKTYYQIAYIGEVPFKVEGITSDDPELVWIDTPNHTWINTRVKTDWPTEGDYVIDRTSNPIKITYENAAIDVNGKKHNVIITINKITFTNLERIQTNEGRYHDSNI